MISNNISKVVLIKSTLHLNKRQNAKTIRMFSANDQYVQNRQDYMNEVLSRRKEWQSQIKSQNEKTLAEKNEMTKRTIITNAINLREKKVRATKIAERIRINRERIHQQYMEHIAKMQVKRDIYNAKKDERVANLKSDLSNEQKDWITKSNLMSKINSNLFSKPSTTGVTNCFSEYWRYQPITLNIKREISPKVLANLTVGSEGKSGLRSQVGITKKMMVQDFLEPMIVTGDDRSNFKTLVDEFSDRFTDLKGFDHLDTYFSMLEAKNQIEKEEEIELDEEFPDRHKSAKFENPKTEFEKKTDNTKTNKFSAKKTVKKGKKR
jgi:hypothetical protein